MASSIQEFEHLEIQLEDIKLAANHFDEKNVIEVGGFGKILVYEYASRGSLDNLLKYATFTWTERIKVFLDAAKGLCYLHDPKETYQRLIHFDIKSANILLEENFKAKVADFGLSNICTLTKESDVYYFEEVLIEVMCGKLYFEYSNGEIKAIYVPMWKQNYEENNL
ncbi:kinase-like domain, phloem protein 2-like protein [Tanacetum coccineum]